MVKTRSSVFSIITIVIIIICAFFYLKEIDVLRPFFFDYVTNLKTSASSNKLKKIIKMREFVAHAGGGIQNLTYTNSLEALNYSYNKGFRFFEVDLVWTSDKKLVLIHGWGSSSTLFNVEPRRHSLREFKGFKMINDLTQMSLDDLINWMIKYPDTHIITDIKSNNLEGLNKISKEYPGLRYRFIPQIYSFKEYEQVKKIGFENIILTLYVMNYDDVSVIKFLKNHKVSALTMWDSRANKEFIKKLKKLGVFVYVHTVNNIDTKNKLKILGVDGFYTDFLHPNEYKKE